MRFWVNTYHPLAGTPDGPWTAVDPPLAPYADASCRREPDLEAQFPAITGLCRPPSVRQFRDGDVVVYFTVKGQYDGLAGHRRLTAVLRVIAETTSHAAAGDWYRDHGSPFPRNLILPGNPPLPLGMTEGFYRRPRRNGALPVMVRPTGPADHARIVTEWNALYIQRKNQCQDVRICEALFVDVLTGRTVNDEVTERVFDGAFPNTEHRPQQVASSAVLRLLRSVALNDAIERIWGTADPS